MRITPAYAGNTPLSDARFLITWDHPRLRGEHLLVMGFDIVLVGSPPHTRGTLCVIAVNGVKSGITPAYAGNT